MDVEVCSFCGSFAGFPNVKMAAAEALHLGKRVDEARTRARSRRTEKQCATFEAALANSSAVVSLGKLGRVEVMPNSSLKLSFTDNGVSGTLDSGKVRFSTSSGVTSSVMTKDGSAVADNAVSAAAHRALGFEEVEVIRCFRKPLARGADR